MRACVHARRRAGGRAGGRICGRTCGCMFVRVSMGTSACVCVYVCEGVGMPCPWPRRSRAFDATPCLQTWPSGDHAARGWLATQAQAMHITCNDGYTPMAVHRRLYNDGYIMTATHRRLYNDSHTTTALQRRIYKDGDKPMAIQRRPYNERRLYTGGYTRTAMHRWLYNDGYATTATQGRLYKDGYIMTAI